MEMVTDEVLKQYLQISEEDERYITEVLRKQGYSNISEIGNEARLLTPGCGEVLSREIGMRGRKEDFDVDVLTFFKPDPNIRELFTRHGPTLRSEIELEGRLKEEEKNRAGIIEMPVQGGSMKIVGETMEKSMVLYYEIGSLDHLEMALPKFEIARRVFYQGLSKK